MSTETKSESKVLDAMLLPSDFPVMHSKTLLKEALDLMTSRALGVACIVDEVGVLKAIFTDGDIRRKLLKIQKPSSALLADDVLEHAICNPLTINPDSSLHDALRLMEGRKVWDLPVVDNHGKLVGLLHMHSVIKALLLRL